MSNSNYINGRAKEYRIMNKLKSLGYDIVFRSAGSHSSIDCVGISKSLKRIILVQSKPKKFSHPKSVQILEENQWLNDEFLVQFKLISDIKEVEKWNSL